eukprot:5820634-Pleurochrysis_carterae.AAC.1
MDTHEHAYGIAAAAYCDQMDRALCGSPERMDHIQVAEALAETCYRLGCRGKSPLEWSPVHLLEELDDTRMMEAYLKYKLTLGIESIQTKGRIHEALSRKRWGSAPRTPRLWEPDELVTNERNIKTGPITFHRALAEIGVAEWADIYNKTTREYYTMGELCKRYGVKKNARITQEYSNVKRLHTKQLHETEQGALGILWGRHKKDLLNEREEVEHIRRIRRVKEKRKTAECWGGEEYLIEWDDGETKWVNKSEMQNMSGADAAFIHREKERAREGTVTFAEYMIDYGIDASQQTWGNTWREFIQYAQGGEKGRSAGENAGIDERRREMNSRKSHPTLYPGKVEDEDETHVGTGRQRRNMTGLTDRAKTNQYRKERKGETHENKRLRLAKEDHGTRRVSEQPEQRPGGGEWEMPTHKTDKEARELLGGYDGRGRHRVFKNEAMDLAHDERYAGHPILRLFTRPEEMENGTYMRASKEDVTHMNTASGKKLTYDTLVVAMTLHERHTFHIAVATDGAKKGGSKVRGETQKLSETTYGAWQGPDSVEILNNKRREATALQKRLGVRFDQTDKLLAIKQGILSGRLGDSATAAEAELFAIFAVLRKIQAQQHMGRYGEEKARVLIMSDCLAGLRVIEKVWRGERNIYRKLQNGAVLEAILNVRETLGTVVFMWIPSHVGITPNVLADNIATQEQEEAPDGMVTGLISKQVKSRPIIYNRRVRGQLELADNPIYQEVRRRGK